MTDKEMLAYVLGTLDGEFSLTGSQTKLLRNVLRQHLRIQPPDNV